LQITGVKTAKTQKHVIKKTAKYFLYP